MQQHVLAPLHQLVVHGLHVDHQALVDPPEQDHHQRREQIERDALRGAGLHAGRSGDRLGAGVEPDRVVGFREQRRIAIVGDADGQCPALLGFAQACQRERRRPAGGDGDQHIVAVDPGVADEVHGVTDLVLGAFDGLHQGFVPAGNEEQQALLRPAEGRHQLGAVLNREAARSAGPGIDQPAALAQPRLDRERGRFERLARGADRGDRGELPLDHGIQDVGRVPDIDPGIPGAQALGFHRLCHHILPQQQTAFDPFRLLGR